MSLDMQIANVNRLSNDVDGIYHEIAQHFELTDNIYWVFYILYDSDEAVTQSDLSREWTFSKKTVNSSITAMTKSGWITLELLPNSRKLKAICLTSTGQQLCQRVGNLTRQIEQGAYARLSAKELDQFLQLFKRLNDGFRESTDTLLAADDK